MSATNMIETRPTLRETVALIRTDVRARRRYDASQPGATVARSRVGLMLSPPVLGLILFRLSHWLYGRRSRALAWMCWVLQQILTGMEITPESEIGPGFVVTNTAGVVISAQIGANAVLHARACLGGRIGSDQNDASRYGVPIVGDNVVFGEASLIVGRITIGDGALIAAGAFVMRDVPAGMGAAGHPAKVVPRSEVGWPLPVGEPVS